LPRVDIVDAAEEQRVGFPRLQTPGQQRVPRMWSRFKLRNQEYHNINSESETDKTGRIPGPKPGHNTLKFTFGNLPAQRTLHPRWNDYLNTCTQNKQIPLHPDHLTPGFGSGSNIFAFPLIARQNGDGTHCKVRNDGLGRKNTWWVHAATRMSLIVCSACLAVDLVRQSRSDPHSEAVS
jgi:hypothetical protein